MLGITPQDFDFCVLWPYLHWHMLTPQPYRAITHRSRVNVGWKSLGGSGHNRVSNARRFGHPQLGGAPAARTVTQVTARGSKWFSCSVIRPSASILKRSTTRNVALATGNVISAAAQMAVASAFT